MPLGEGKGALALTTARYFTPSGRSIQALGVVPDMEVLQDVPDVLKGRADLQGEASMPGHLTGDGEEQSGSQAYVPPDPKDDKAMRAAFTLLRGAVSAGMPKAAQRAVPN
jgi:carboxyl-terminal processing protease